MQANSPQWMFVVVLALAAAPAVAQNCNLQDVPCQGQLPCDWSGCTKALGGCGVSNPIAHASADVCGSGGSFDLNGTQYERTCATGADDCQVSVPPIRFWGFEQYRDANYGCGCPNPERGECGMPAGSGGEWLLHPSLDVGHSSRPGHWLLYQTNWQGCAVDGCPSVGGMRTVVEITKPYADVEGTEDHEGWYLIASVDRTSYYDFDRVRGADALGACGPATLQALPVPGLTIVGRAEACVGDDTPTVGVPNRVDGAYQDFAILLDEPAPSYFTEGGHNDSAIPLIAGYQIVYAGGLPTSSDYKAGGWQPVREPTDPARMRLGVVPFGQTGAVTVSLPSGLFWLATRIVYRDGTVNPTVAFPVEERGPRITSAVSRHCGPVAGCASPGTGNGGYETCAIQATLVGDHKSCDGREVMLGVEIDAASECCLPGPSGRVEYECSWYRNGLLVGGSDCSLTDAPGTDAVYTVTAACKLPASMCTQVFQDLREVASATSTATPLREFVAHRDGDDTILEWPDGTSYQYNVVWSPWPTSQRADWQFLGSTTANQFLDVGAVSASGLRYYQVIAVGCDGVEEPEAP